MARQSALGLTETKSVPTPSARSARRPWFERLVAIFGLLALIGCQGTIELPNASGDPGPTIGGSQTGGSAGNGGIGTTGGSGGASAGGAGADTCAPGLAACAGACVAPASDPAHCGACGNACPAGAGCQSGSCTCPAGFVLCGASCVDVATSAGHCGACNVVCGTGQSCIGGSCACPDGRTNCAGACVDTTSDGNHCGSCDAACPAGQACSGAQCVTTCATGETRCSNACVRLDSSPEHCGQCDAQCASGLTCSGGSCGCPDAGDILCGVQCVDPTSNPEHCGACNAPCSAGQTCQGGVCACPAGQSSCGGQCRNTQTDNANCGACGNACSGGRSCSQGECVCPSGQTFCGNACVNTATSTSHCGACNNACAAGMSCTNGSCACPAGQTSCSGQCRNTQTDNANCGTCGNACSGGRSCSQGQCVCPSGQTFCGNACVNTATSTSHCGACNNACGSGQTCNSGTCSGGSTGKFVGNITHGNNLPSNFLNYWNQLTPENEGKWASIEGTRNSMNWSKIDQYYQFTRTNRIPFKQHTFVWGQQAPSWINGLSQAQQAAEIEEWIRLFCQRYPDVELIDVVNEPDHAKPDGQNGRANFYQALGGNGATGHDWVIRAFQLARQYCPRAILILNDYNVLRWDTDNFVSIANKVKNAAPMGGRSLLDAVGCQAHGLENQAFSGQANGGSLTTNLNKVIGIGVPIYISEYDVNLADDTQQLNVMRQQFTLFYETPQIAGITLWGYIYGQTWVANSGLIRNGQFRPAMTWLMGYLGR